MMVPRGSSLLPGNMTAVATKENSELGASVTPVKKLVPTSLAIEVTTGPTTQEKLKVLESSRQSELSPNAIACETGTINLRTV